MSCCVHVWHARIVKQTHLHSVCQMYTCLASRLLGLSSRDIPAWSERQLAPPAGCRCHCRWPSWQCTRPFNVDYRCQGSGSDALCSYRVSQANAAAMAAATLDLMQRVCDTKVDVNDKGCCGLLSNAFMVTGERSRKHALHSI